MHHVLRRSLLLLATALAVAGTGTWYLLTHPARVDTAPSAPINMPIMAPLEPSTQPDYDAERATAPGTHLGGKAVGLPAVVTG